MLLSTIEKTCRARTTQLFKHLGSLGFHVHDTVEGRFAFRPGQSPTSPLVVCHADTVRNGGEHGHSFHADGGILHSIALDDRLGISMMLHAIQSDSDESVTKWMADCSMLICDDEEIGRSTASLFAAELPDNFRPNWMFELDRRGTDVVMYEYETPILRGLLADADFDIGQGSFSDICNLESLGVVGFNCGIGYHNEHSNKCHADLVDVLDQMIKLGDFYAKFCDIRLAHEPSRWFDHRSTSYEAYEVDHYDYATEDEIAQYIGYENIEIFRSEYSAAINVKGGDPMYAWDDVEMFIEKWEVVL